MFGRVTISDAELKLNTLRGFLNLKYLQMDDYLIEGELLTIQGVYNTGSNLHIEKLLRPKELERNPIEKDKFEELSNNKYQFN